MPQSPDEIRAKLRELGYLKNPLDRFVFGAGSARGALALALDAGARGAVLAGPLIGLFSIVLLGKELAPDERLSWFLALSLLAALIVFTWVVAQALALHALARLRGRALDALPAVAVILSGITFLLPALLWLLASRRIQSAALREGKLGALALAVGLLLSASAMIYLATRAADVFALGRIEAVGARHRGWRSAVIGLLSLGIFAAVLARSNRADIRISPGAPYPHPERTSRRLSVIAVDGVAAGSLRAEAAGFRRLTDYPADPNLIAGWMKIQTGHADWNGMSMTGYRARWGGRGHEAWSGPGRLLKLLRPYGLSTVAPLPGRIERPLFFWEIPDPDRILVSGGWHSYPFFGRNPRLFSDRLFTSLLGGAPVDGTYSDGPLASRLGARWPEKLYAEIRTEPPSIRISLFYAMLSRHAIEGCDPRPGSVDADSACPSLEWLYLPGADIACATPDSPTCRRTREIAEIAIRRDSGAAGSEKAVLLIENPGRRGGTGAIWFRPAGNETIRPIHAPEEVAAAVLDYLGYPLAADLAGVTPAEAALSSYGKVILKDPGDASDDATLKALKQLGYIQ